MNGSCAWYATKMRCSFAMIILCVVFVQAHDAFEKFDVDHSGCIDAWELKEVCSYRIDKLCVVIEIHKLTSPHCLSILASHRSLCLLPSIL